MFVSLMFRLSNLAPRDANPQVTRAGADTPSVKTATDQHSVKSQLQLGDSTNMSAAFHASRLVLVTVFGLSYVTTESTRGWSAMIASVVAAAGLIISLAYFVYRAKTRFIGENLIDRLPGWVLIGIDAVIALGIILMAGVNSAPLAWVALVIPVTEAAITYSIVPAAVVWLGLSLAHMSFVVTSTNESTPLLALQQLMAVLLVAVPAAMLSSAVRDHITALNGDRERAKSQTTQLEVVALGAEKMSEMSSREDVLAAAVVAMTDIGFDQADIVTGTDAEWKTVVRHHPLHNAAVDNAALSSQASASDSVVVVRPDSDEARQMLHSADMEWGCALRLDTIGFPEPAVLRAWTRDSVSDEAQTLRAFSLLAQQVSNIHSNTVTSEWAAEETERLSYAAAHDPLTGVANHSNIMSTLANLQEMGATNSAFFVDLDRFKPINDTLGHEAGNQALIIISRRLEELVGNAGTVGRMGGDEFIVVGERNHLMVGDEVYGLTTLIYNAICAPMIIDGVTVSVGASVGACSEDASVTPDELVRRADVAMYSAKRSGGGGLIWDPSLETRTSDTTYNPVASSRDTPTSPAAEPSALPPLAQRASHPSPSAVAETDATDFSGAHHG